MAELIERSREVVNVERFHEFSRIDDPGSGFWFPVDENDEIIVEPDNTAMQANIELSKDTSVFMDMGIRESRNTYRTSNVYKCCCGSRFETERGHDGDCRCGRRYNFAGQMLNADAPRF